MIICREQADMTMAVIALMVGSGGLGWMLGYFLGRSKRRA